MEKKRAKIAEVEAQLAELTKEQQRKPAKEKSEPKAEPQQLAGPDPNNMEASGENRQEPETSSQEEAAAAPQPDEMHIAETPGTGEPTAPTESNPDDAPPGA
jgi:hypothetical protein